MQQHLLIRATSGPRTLIHQGADGEPLEWLPCAEAAAEATAGPEELWVADECLLERQIKLYEDHLAELGVSKLGVRLREFEHGWEVRVRWWSVLNPGLLPRRGVSHARLRDSTIRVRLLGHG